MAATLQETVDLLWKFPPGYNPEFSIDEEEEWIAQHRAKFPPLLAAQYGALLDAEDDTLESHLAFYDFAYTHCLHEEFSPSMMHAARLASAQLCNSLRQRQPTTLVDLGAGDGKIAAAIALQVPSIKRIYAVEILPSALACMDKYFGALPAAEQALVREVITPVHGDYSSAAFTQEFQAAHGRADVALGAFPLYYPSYVQHARDFGNSLLTTVCLPPFCPLDEGMRQLSCMGREAHQPMDLLDVQCAGEKYLLLLASPNYSAEQSAQSCW